MIKLFVPEWLILKIKRDVALYGFPLLLTDEERNELEAYILVQAYHQIKDKM